MLAIVPLPGEAAAPTGVRDQAERPGELSPGLSFLIGQAETCAGQMGCGHEGQSPSTENLLNSGLITPLSLPGRRPSFWPIPRKAGA